MLAVEDPGNNLLDIPRRAASQGDQEQSNPSMPHSFLYAPSPLTQKNPSSEHSITILLQLGIKQKRNKCIRTKVRPFRLIQ